MASSSRHPPALIVLAFMTLSGCSAGIERLDRRRGVGGSETSVPIEEVPVRGHEIDLAAFGDDRRYNVSGELLAIDPVAIWVLESSGDVAWVPRDDLLDVKIELYDSAASETALWTTIGSLTTASHGFFLILTLPMWVGTGTAASIGASESNNLVVPVEAVDALYQFARFPQGLPPEFVREKPRYAAEWLGPD
jgi:hypothetical protein